MKRIVLFFLCCICLITMTSCDSIQSFEYKADYQDNINQLMSDDKEIERKWLINPKNIPYDLNDEKVEVFEIKQTYICFKPEIRVRDYNNGEFYEFTVKTNMTEDGLVRDEMVSNISKAQYDHLMAKKEGNTINKTRYQFLDGDNVIAIDIFHDQLEGLAYMEVEFMSVQESNEFKTPDWVIKDVTDDVNYKNGQLARHGIPER